MIKVCLGTVVILAFTAPLYADEPATEGDSLEGVAQIRAEAQALRPIVSATK